jgi:hypothetical protein
MSTDPAQTVARPTNLSTTATIPPIIAAAVSQLR